MKNWNSTKEQVEAELSMRPELPCDVINKKTQEMTQDTTEMTKKKTDFEREIDKTRLGKVIETFYKQASDNLELNDTRTSIIQN
jgi:hypothetical protein